eukprot:scaffold22396_cov56-Phaeocystis_antarctica.AAC.5
MHLIRVEARTGEPDHFGSTNVGAVRTCAPCSATGCAPKTTSHVGHLRQRSTTSGRQPAHTVAWPHAKRTSRGASSQMMHRRTSLRHAILLPLLLQTRDDLSQTYRHCFVAAARLFIGHPRCLPAVRLRRPLLHVPATLPDVCGGQTGQRHKHRHAERKGVGQHGGLTSLQAATRECHVRGCVSEQAVCTRIVIKGVGGALDRVQERGRPLDAAHRRDRRARRRALLPFGRARKPKVGEACRAAVNVEQDVGWLNVAVQQALSGRQPRAPRERRRRLGPAEGEEARLGGGAVRHQPVLQRATEAEGEDEARRMRRLEAVAEQRQ